MVQSLEKLLGARVRASPAHSGGFGDALLHAVIQCLRAATNLHLPLNVEIFLSLLAVKGVPWPR